MGAVCTSIILVDIFLLGSNFSPHQHSMSSPENMVSSLMNGFGIDGDELFDRDVYGFAVRPQHREIYREYSDIYKVELDRQSN